MPFTFDEATYKISLPPGDTGDLYISVDWDLQGKEAVILFAVIDPSGEDILLKVTDLIDGTAHIRLCNRDTRDMAPGMYRWQLRIVTSPAKDAEGNICVDDDTDDVVSIFDDMPAFILLKKGACV